MLQLPIDKPYTVREVCGLLGFSRQTIERMFRNEPGVLLIKRPTENRKRRYTTFRIPRHVYERVYRRLEV